MKDIALEILICTIVAALLMIIHELTKSIAYLCVRRAEGRKVSQSSNILAVWRYVDPLGMLLSVVCLVPFSKPYLFRIRDKKTNMVLGITGFSVLFALFVGSIFILKTTHAFPLFWQYVAILSFDMFIANMFPISTFDIGLVIAGVSSRHYLHIIKADSAIKLIFIVALMSDLIRFICVKLLGLILW